MRRLMRILALGEDIVFFFVKEKVPDIAAAPLLSSSAYYQLAIFLS